MAVEFDLQGLLLHLVSAGAVVGALAWVGTVLGKHLIDRKVSEYKAKLDHQNAAAIEDMRAATSRELERLRSELRVSAYSMEIRIAELHKRRADVVAEVYRQVAVVHAAFADATRLIEYPSDKPRRDRLLVAIEAAKDFDGYVAQKRIFLPEKACAELDVLLMTLRKVIVGSSGNGGEWPAAIGDPRLDRIRDDMTAAWSTVEHGLPAIRRALELSLRELLGEG